MNGVFVITFLIMLTLSFASFDSLNSYENGAKWSEGIAGLILYISKRHKALQHQDGLLKKVVLTTK